MKRLFVLLWLLSIIWSPLNAMEKRPDERTVQQILDTLAGWSINSSGRCAVLKGSDVWAWKLVLTRPIDPRLKNTSARDGKGYLIIVLIPDAGVHPGNVPLQVFDWTMPANDLHQQTVFLGRGSGYYWYVKTDVGNLYRLQSQFRIKEGIDMDQLMANALNIVDYQGYSIQTAIGYFKGKGSKMVPLILRSMKKWQEEENKPPLHHIVALHATACKEATDELMKLAQSSNPKIAHTAISQLVQPPYMAPDAFYHRVLSVPEYTATVVGIFRERKKTQYILPKLHRMLKHPRTIGQYVVTLGAIREFEYRGKFKHIPEFDAINDLLFLTMRMGDTRDTIQYIPLEGQGQGSVAKVQEEEKKRIEPLMKALRKSKDHELVFAGGLVLATFDPHNKGVSQAYVIRIRKIGIEILRLLPLEFVRDRMNMLNVSLELSAERQLLHLVRKEYDGRG